MKEKNQDDILYVSENRPIKPSNKTPISSEENMKTASSINPKHLTYNKLIGRRGKYNKNELLISSEKDATFTIICEKPVVNGGEYESGNNNVQQSGFNCDCFGLFKNSGSGSGSYGNEQRECYNFIICIIFLSMIIFLPLGLLFFIIFYLCTKNNSNMWR